MEMLGKKYKWYSAFISRKEWSDYYSKIPGYTKLDNPGKGIRIGFLSVEQPFGALEITNQDDLKIIDQNLKRQNYRPFIFEEKEPIQVEISEVEF
jgi:hypothetical protein